VTLTCVLVGGCPVARPGDRPLDQGLIPPRLSAQPAIFRPEIEMDGTRTLVLVDQMRAVDASRLGDFAGRLGASETGEVGRAIKLILAPFRHPGRAAGTVRPPRVHHGRALEDAGAG
jgi:mRNA interferase MazF